jgi:predicted DNA-binding transcriptional regulator YafY
MARAIITVPQGRMIKLFEMMAALRSGTHRVEILAAMMDCSTRTIYRYINLLEAIGVQIDCKVDTNEFFIAPGTCPLCGRKEACHE